MQDIMNSFGYFDKAINKTLPVKIHVVDLTPRANKIKVTVK